MTAPDDCPALPPLPPSPATWRRDCVWIAVAFVGMRLAVLAVFALRGLTFPFIDAEGYIRHAAWLAQHGNFAVPEADGGRFFSGMPLIVAAIGRMTGEFAWTGLGVNMLAGVGAALLFYLNVGRRDWALWHAALLPAWVSMTATFHSEAGLWCFALLGLTLLRIPLSASSRRLLWVVAGYAAVCRPTAIFILAPMLAQWLLRQKPNWRAFTGDAMAASVLPILVTLWTWRDTHHLFPQGAWQAREFAWWSNHYGGGFPTTVFAWPGQSFWVGLQSSGVRPAIKLLNLAHLVVWLGAAGLAIRGWLRQRHDTLAGLLALELLANGAFVLCIGGPFGHTIFYRFLATHANAFIVLAWFRYTSIPAPMWWTAATASVGLAAAVARSG